jgi:hypothetical protein
MADWRADEVAGGRRRKTGTTTTRGPVLLTKRWVVEQVNGIMMLHRRLVRDY